jgi:hypothetical protein
MDESDHLGDIAVDELFSMSYCTCLALLRVPSRHKATVSINTAAVLWHSRSKKTKIYCSLHILKSCLAYTRSNFSEEWNIH